MQVLLHPYPRTVKIKKEVLQLISNISWSPYFENTLLKFVELV